MGHSRHRAATRFGPDHFYPAIGAAVRDCRHDETAPDA